MSEQDFDHEDPSPDDYPANVPLPQYAYLSPWQAAHWRAFGHWHFCEQLHTRSWDQGTVQLPEDTDESHPERVLRHNKLDRAEQEVRNLLALAKVTSAGQGRVWRGAQLLSVPDPNVTQIPAHTYLNGDLVFGSDGEVRVRSEFLAAQFEHDLHTTAADPTVPLYHNVLIPTVELRAIWEEPSAQTQPATSNSTIKGRGGRRPWGGRSAFIREMMRQANTVDGLSSRRETGTRMRAWCDKHWDGDISDESIRKMVIEFAPEDLPPE